MVKIDMQMPTSCFSCPFVNREDTFACCRITWRNLSKQVIDRRDTNCPLKNDCAKSSQAVSIACGDILGDIKGADTVVCYGNVLGNVKANNVIFMNDAVVNGNLKASLCAKMN